MRLSAHIVVTGGGNYAPTADECNSYLPRLAVGTRKNDMALGPVGPVCYNMKICPQGHHPRRHIIYRTCHADACNI